MKKIIFINECQNPICENYLNNHDYKNFIAQKMMPFFEVKFVTSQCCEACQFGKGQLTTHESAMNKQLALEQSNDVAVISSNDENLNSGKIVLDSKNKDINLQNTVNNFISQQSEKRFLSNTQKMHRLTFEDVDVDSLTYKEYKILSLFLNSPTLSVRREELIKAIWPKSIVGEKTIDVHICNLKKKLKAQNIDIVRKEIGTWGLLSFSQI